MANADRVVIDGVNYGVGNVASVNSQTGDVNITPANIGAVAISDAVTGVKGNAESTYRNGQVNITPANIGAKATQIAIPSPERSGNSIQFIDTISQNEQGIITATKKQVQEATSTQAGILSSSKFREINAIKNLATSANALALAAYPAMSAHGDDVTIAGTIAAPLRGMTIYGKSVQSSTPAPDAPVDIVTVGGDGTLAVSLTDGNNTGTYNLPTAPNGLPGIKDTSGNYTDASSQKWLCDTIDKAAGTHTQRVGVLTLDGSYTPTTISAVGNYTLFWYQVSETSIVPSTGTLCSHLPYDPSGYAQERAGFGIDASYPRNIWAKLPTSLVGSTAASIKAWMQSNPMTLVAALAAPVTTDLTAEQTSALASMTAFDGSTRVYTSGAVSPDLDVSAAVTVEAYVDYRLSNSI